MEVPLFLYDSNLELIGKTKGAPDLDEETFSFLADKGKYLDDKYEYYFYPIEDGFAVTALPLKNKVKFTDEWRNIGEKISNLNREEKEIFELHAKTAVNSYVLDENINLLNEINALVKSQIEKLKKELKYIENEDDNIKKKAHFLVITILGTYISNVSKVLMKEKYVLYSDVLKNIIEKSESTLMPMKIKVYNDIPTNIKLQRDFLLGIYAAFEEILEISLKCLIGIQFTLEDTKEETKFFIQFITDRDLEINGLSEKNKELLSKTQNFTYEEKKVVNAEHGICFEGILKKEV